MFGPKYRITFRFEINLFGIPVNITLIPKNRYFEGILTKKKRWVSIQLIFYEKFGS